MRWLRSLLLPLVLIACVERQPAAPIEDGPVLNWMNNEWGGGSRVIRWEGLWWWYWSDGPYAVMHTTAWFDPNPFSCGPTDPSILEGWSFQDIWLQDGSQTSAPWFNRIAQEDEVWIVVLDRSKVGNCWGLTLVAEGTGHLRYTNNDYLADQPNDRENANAWGVNAHAALRAVAGGTTMYNGHWRAVWDPDGSPPLRENVQINIH